MTQVLVGRRQVADDPARKVRVMSEQFYSDARLYDRLFPGGEQAVDS
jgi:hypothetical protein